VDRDEAILRMQEFVDGEFDEAETEAMQQLIATDPEVEKVWREHKKYTTTMLDALGKLRPRGDEVEKRVLERLRTDRESGLEALPAPEPRGRVVLWPYVLAAAIMVVIVLALLLQPAGGELARVQSVEGTVTLQPADEGARPDALAAGDLLRSGDAVLARDGRALLDFPAAEVQISPGSSVEFHRDGRSTDLWMTSPGHIAVRGERTPDAAGELVVHAGRVLVRRHQADDAPARFTLTVQPDGGVHVASEAGRVEVSNAETQLILQPGQRVLARDTGALEVAEEGQD
jgi:ferric-dicitrate binding protein FerR (iron transport regulator)